MNNYTFLKSIGFAGLVCLIYLLSNAVVILPIEGIRAFYNPLDSFLENNKGWYIMFQYAIPFLILFLSYHFWAKRNHYIPIEIKNNNLRLIFYVLAFVAMVGAMITSDYLTSLIPVDNEIFAQMLEEMEKILKEGFKQYPVKMFITVAILAPICEEIMFRGIILENLLKKGANPYMAIVVTAFCFGLIHGNPWQFVAALLSGSVMGYIYYKSRSLLSVVLLHAFNNGLVAIAMIVLGEDNSFKNVQEVTSFSSETSLIIGMILLTVSLYLIHKKDLKPVLK